MENGNLQFNIEMDIEKQSDNVEKQEFSKEEVSEDTNTEENGNILEYKNNKLEKRIEHLIAYNNKFETKINARNIEIVVSKNENHKMKKNREFISR